MVRFLHTADWQLGMKGGNLGTTAEVVRKTRIEACRKLLAMASEEKVDFVLIAGDLFENNAVSRDVVEQALSLFDEASGIPIYILPGNHDPFEPDSIYLQRIWRAAPSNVKVLAEKKPMKLDGLDTILYPCPIQQKRSRSDPTDWIPKENVEQIRICIAHGTLEIGLTTEPNFPINPRRVEESGLDYLALGDWHSLFIHKDPAGAQRTVYPGTPEATSFDERDPGHVVIIELNKGEEPKIKVENCGQLKWTIWKEEHIESERDIEALTQRVRNLENRDNTLLKLILEGLVDAEVCSMTEELNAQLKGYLLYLDVDTSALRLKPSVRSMLGVVPEGPLIKVAESLEALLSREPWFSKTVEVSPEELERRLEEIRELRREDLDPVVAQRALSLLYQFSKEVKE